MFAASAGAATVAFLQTDSSAAGNWKGVYGQDGNVICQHSVLVPSYAVFDTAGSVNLYVKDIWASDPRALLKQYYSYSSSERIESYFHTVTSMDFLIGSKDSQPHRIALYFADYERLGRSITVQALDTASGAVLDSRPLTNYQAGIYLVYNYTGNVTFRIVNNNPGQYTPTGSVSAFFWGGGAAAQPAPSLDTTPPTVSIATPGSGAVSGIVGLTANASDNVGVASVQYQLDGANLGSPLTAAPYPLSWNTSTVPNGSHTLKAVATDAAGNAAQSAAVTVNVSNAVSDTTPPSVSIATPGAGAVSGPVAITANANDNVGVASVQYQLDGGNLGSALTTPPYTFPWNTLNTSNGAHTLTAVARDAAGNTASSPAVAVTVNNAALPAGGNSIAFLGTDTSTLGNWKGVYGQDGNVMAQHSTLVPSYSSFNTAGAVNLYLLDMWATDPRALLKQFYSYTNTERIESYWHTTTSMDFLVTSNDGQPHRIALYFADYQRQGRSNTIQVLDSATNAVLDSRALADYSGGVYLVYTYTGNVTFRVINNNPGQYTPTAAVSAFYWGGGSAPATTPSGPPPDTTPPTVSISAPASGATVSGAVTIAANATDNTAVASVQFQIDNANFGSPVTLPPYNIAWDTTKVANGSHTITAIARDAAGNTASASIPVTVNNPVAPPPPPPPPPPASGNAVAFLGMDAATKGNWRGVYGQDGNMIAQHSYNAPSYSSFNPINVNQLMITDNTTDVRAPLKFLYSYSATERVMSHWYNRYSMDFQVNTTDNQQHRIALYHADWTPMPVPDSFYPNLRSITVQAINTDTGAVLDSRQLTDYTGGVYLVYNYTGNITFRVINNWDGAREHPNGTVTAFFWGGSGLPQ